MRIKADAKARRFIPFDLITVNLAAQTAHSRPGAANLFSKESHGNKDHSSQSNSSLVFLKLSSNTLIRHPIVTLLDK